MQFSKKVSVGNWIGIGKDKPIQDSILVKIASDGQQVPGKYGTQNVFLVKTQKGDEGNLAFNQTSINNMIDAYGEDSVEWVGKVAKVWLLRQVVQGSLRNICYLAHPKAEIVEDGGGFRWEIPGAQSEAPTKPVAPAQVGASVNSSGVPYPQEEIDPSDIPF